MTKHVMVFVDGPNADNQACAWGALNAFADTDVRLAGVVVSATAVNYQHNAPLGSRDIEVSREVHILHTARMAGLFHRAGADVPIFMGADIASTDITSPIPHSAHVRHDDYDVFADARGSGYHAIAGNFADALAYMEGLSGEIHLVVGGPFSEIPLITANPIIRNKLGYLAAQAGFDLSTRAIYSKLAFNVDVDVLAALRTFVDYPNKIFVVPSDITRHPSVTFSGAEELIQLGIHGELAETFSRHRKKAERRHQEEQRRREAMGEILKPYPRLSIHDLQAVLALRQAIGAEDDLFEFSGIGISPAIKNLLKVAQLQKETGFPPTTTSDVVETMNLISRNTDYNNVPARYTVTSQNSDLYKQRVPQFLRPYLPNIPNQRAESGEHTAVN